MFDKDRSFSVAGYEGGIVVGDIICAVCGEPWDYYELRHEMCGDVMRMVMRGVGCPCCKGNERRYIEEHGRSLENSDEDVLTYWEG